MKEEKRKRAKKTLVLSGVDKIVQELQKLEDSWAPKEGSLDLTTREGRETTYSSLMRALINELARRIAAQDLTSITTRGLLDVILQMLKALKEETSPSKSRVPLVNIDLREKKWVLEAETPGELQESHSKEDDKTRD